MKNTPYYKKNNSKSLEMQYSNGSNCNIATITDIHIYTYAKSVLWSTAHAQQGMVAREAYSSEVLVISGIHLEHSQSPATVGDTSWDSICKVQVLSTAQPR